MKIKLGILAIVCLVCACNYPRPQSVTEAPILYEQYIVDGGYQSVLADIDAKVEQCMQPIPRKCSYPYEDAYTAAMYFSFTGCEPDSALLVLKLKDLDEERTKIDVYAGDLSKLAWPRLRQSVQYGATRKDGCPDSPQAMLE